MKIFQETDYKKFRTIKGNRDISKKKVARLVASYKSGIDLFPFCPILVNEDFYIIDGQHRFCACKELNKSVFYTVVPNFSLQQIARINSDTDKWKNKDFMQCYTRLGNNNYKLLELFKDKYELTLSVAISLLHNGRCRGGGDFMSLFRDGLFVAHYQDHADKIIAKCYDYETVNPDNWNDRSFIQAIEVLLTSELYNHSEVIEKLKVNKSKIERKSNWKEYIFHIEELFNRKNSIRKFIYKAPK
jgi:hypothetical protein